MRLEDMKCVASIGGGVIGSSWTLLFAMRGLKVWQYDINQEQIDNCVKSIKQKILQVPALTLCNSANGGKALIFRRFRHLPFGRVFCISRRIPA